MFEYDQSVIQDLMNENQNFKRLFDKHGELKKRVEQANSAFNSFDDSVLESMKKEKLLLKDQMAKIIKNHQQAHA